MLFVRREEASGEEDWRGGQENEQTRAPSFDKLLKRTYSEWAVVTR